MDSLLAKAQVFDNSRKRKRHVKRPKNDSILSSVAKRIGLPASLANPIDSEPSTSHRHIKDKKLRAHLQHQSDHTRLTKTLNAEVEDPLFDLTNLGQGVEGVDVGITVEGELEKTWRTSQDEIVKSVSEEAARLRRVVKLDGGPYRVRYTRNGRHLGIVGRKGHVATFDALTGILHGEVNLKETCRDFTFLQDKSFHAVAQKKTVEIYDSSCLSIHRIPPTSILEPNRLTFLPYHYLLVCATLSGHLSYLDTSTGQLIAKHTTKLGSGNCLEQNSQSGVVGVGHLNGVVTFWTPNFSEAVVKLRAHLGPVSGLSVWGEDGLGGKTIATAGADGIVKIWDTRNWKESTRQFHLTKSSISSTPELSFSQKGHLALTTSSGVNIYTPPTSWSSSLSHARLAPPLYLTHPFPNKTHSPITLPHFAPFFDVLAVGHGGGFETMLVPGSAEEKWDSMEADPFESIKMRREREVRGLLDKINPQMITVDPEFVGTIDTTDIPQKRVDVENTPFARLPRMDRLKVTGKADLTGEGDADEGEEEGDEGDRVGGAKEKNMKVKEKNKMRGKNKGLKRHLRKKKKNVIDPATIAIRAKIEKQRALIADSRRKERGEPEVVETGPKSALDRFKR